MDGGEDEIILVKQRHAGLIAGRIGRIKREFGQETLARGIAAGNLLKLNEVSAPCAGVLVNSIEVRLVPKAGALEFSRPAGAAQAQIGDGFNEALPVVPGTGRRGRFRKRYEGTTLRDNLGVCFEAPSPVVPDRYGALVGA